MTQGEHKAARESFRHSFGKLRKMRDKRLPDHYVLTIKVRRFCEVFLKHKAIASCVENDIQLAEKASYEVFKNKEEGHKLLKQDKIQHYLKFLLESVIKVNHDIFAINSRAKLMHKLIMLAMSEKKYDAAARCIDSLNKLLGNAQVLPFDLSLCKTTKQKIDALHTHLAAGDIDIATYEVILKTLPARESEILLEKADNLVEATEDDALKEDSKLGITFDERENKEQANEPQRKPPE